MVKTWLRPLARKLLTPVLRYAVDTPVVMGSSEKLVVGERVALANALLNLSSGSIIIEDRVIFSPNVMVLTGRHEFMNGMRISLDPEFDDGSWGGAKYEVPKGGFDIRIGTGTWVGAGAIILGPVEIGKHSIVAAGSVVTKSFPDHSVLAGVPAKVIGSTFERTHHKVRVEKTQNEESE